MRTVDVLKEFDDAVFDGRYGKATASDRGLSALLNSDIVSKSIKEHTETQEDYFASDSTGFNFHKSFREWGVISDPNLAMAVWSMLHASKIFWATIEAMQVKTAKKAS